MSAGDAVQVRCHRCLREQYAPVVIAVSNGDVPCVWCGAYSWPMTHAQYLDALDTARRGRGRLR